MPDTARYACLYEPPRPDAPASSSSVLVAIAREFSPRYECRADRAVIIDVSGLERLLGPPRVIADALQREAAGRGRRVHVAVAPTHTAALMVALARPGVTVVEPGQERDRLASLPIGILLKIDDSAEAAVSAFNRWGLKTIGELAALPATDLSARLGQPGLVWHAIAHGRDVRPFVPDAPEERFDASLELEWPIEGLEPLSFVLTRLLEPLAVRLERRDRGAAALVVELRLVSKEAHVRRLELPSPIRDVRTLRTLALLELESHPPSCAIDRVTVVIEPTPARILQHMLFARARAAPARLSTLLARLGALMGQDRLGAPATVDSYEPGAFEMVPFAVDHDDSRKHGESFHASANVATTFVSALRRFRRPIPARVTVDEGRPCRVVTDRQRFTGGAVRSAAGPWRTSGNWWAEEGQAGQARQARWNHDEWDVELADGAVYRIFRDRDRDGWFIEGVVD